MNGPDGAVIDRFAAARAVADAVLYEGYVLYPYRASACKNQMRWQFGVLAPRGFSERDASERWSMRTECFADAGDSPTLTVRVRCLQVQHRLVEEVTTGDRGFRAVARLEVDGNVFVPWDEAVEHVIDLAPAPLRLASTTRVESFLLPPGEETEVVRTASGIIAGRIVRRREAIAGNIRVTTARAEGALIKVSVAVENASDWSPPLARRDEAIAHSLVAVHTMLAIDGGEFISLLDPPAHAEAAAASCVNDGTFPVVIGDNRVMLSSPIILYDNPEVAPESPGDLYDSTEIDEILALRVITLTDEEKAEARGTDPRAAAIIDRCDDMSPEQWTRLHGTMRTPPHAVEAYAEVDAEPLPWWDPTVDASVDPWSERVLVRGIDISKGSAVRLRPSRRADAHDIFFGGLAATVAGVFRDVDDEVHVAVTIDSDPAAEELVWQGRYLFFYPDEIEPIIDAEVGR